jgi:hypothetical protein
LQSILDRGRRTRFIHTFKQTLNVQRSHPTFNSSRFALRTAPLECVTRATAPSGRSASTRNNLAAANCLVEAAP